MWSGPRNISTAMMRSWESRGDCAVTDEPLYGVYLRARPEVAHPGRDEVIAAMESDWRAIARTLTGEIPGGKPIWYQKHMAHHLVGGIGREWVLGGALVNCFLIREPREVLVSLAKVMPNPGLRDTGLPQQVELFEAERARTGRVPPLVDARDVLEDPRGTLAALCAAVGVAFDARMLQWAPGPRPTDGVWARHWYANVEASTGFEPYRERAEPLPEGLEPVLREARGLYERMHRHRLTA
ncbi:MAG: HAD family hydrolase [Phycisphaerae bacterium]|nr:HAD family hydrolase [Phycisphaerae bacterium]